MSLSIAQDYNAYQDVDHETWLRLCRIHDRLDNTNVCQEYLDGYHKLKLNSKKIAHIDEVSRRLERISGWKLIPVNGLIPTKDFFYMLVKKIYPINVSIRPPDEFNFSEQPDIFHDIFGHLPLLTNEKFAKFLTDFSRIALKYVDDPKAIELLGCLYWYTFEIGIIKEGGENKAYGGAFITSIEEMENLNNKSIPKRLFSLEMIFGSSFNPYKLQDEYFVINSFQELFNVVEGLEENLLKHLKSIVN